MMAIDVLAFDDDLMAEAGSHFLLRLTTFIWEHAKQGSELRRILDSRDGWAAAGWYPLDKLASEDYAEAERLVEEYGRRYYELNGSLLAEIQADELCRLSGVRQCIQEKMRRMRE
jgi:hypothetical protein